MSYPTIISDSGPYLCIVFALRFGALALCLRALQAVLLALLPGVLRPAVRGQVRTRVQQNLMENLVGDAPWKK